MIQQRKVREIAPGGPSRRWVPGLRDGALGEYICQECSVSCDGVYRLSGERERWVCSSCRDRLRACDSHLHRGRKPGRPRSFLPGDGFSLEQDTLTRLKQALVADGEYLFVHYQAVVGVGSEQ
jgi:hypothetical protein